MGKAARKIKITKSKIDSIAFVEQGQPAAVYRDSELIGFCLRVGEQSKTFYVNRRVEGKPAWIRIGTYGAITPDQARRHAIQELGKMESGINPNNEKKVQRIEGMTLRQALEEYLKANKDLSERTAKDYQNVLNRYAGNPDKYPYMNWMDGPISAITSKIFKQAYQRLGVSTPSGAEHLRSALHVICEYALEQYDGEIISLNPARIRKEFRYKSKPMHRRIADEHLPAFFHAMDKLEGFQGRVSSDYFLFTLLNDLRKSESANLKWSDVNLKENTFTVFKTKNKNPHILPCTKQALAIINRRLTSKTNEYVFPRIDGTGSVKDPRKQLMKVIALMNLEVSPQTPLPKLKNGYFAENDLPKIYFTPHDLRRTFAGIAKQVISGDWISRLLNHISEQPGAAVTKRHYMGHEYVADLYKPLQAVADKIDSFANRANK